MKHLISRKEPTVRLRRYYASALCLLAMQPCGFLRKSSLCFPVVKTNLAGQDKLCHPRAARTSFQSSDKEAKLLIGRHVDANGLAHKSMRSCARPRESARNLQRCATASVMVCMSLRHPIAICGLTCSARPWVLRHTFSVAMD